ncbi:MAG: hypothetical protein IJY52_05740 [Anaerotignum sp.]|nr:hypothetical protein [Anaerotignum sp.]
MTPKDWNKIAKLLEPVADQKTLQEVKTLLEGMGDVAAQETADAILAKLNSGVMAGFRKPINSTSIAGKGSFSGTGKGRLFVRTVNPIEGTVDGVAISCPCGSQYNQMSVEFEFTSSFYIDCDYGYFAAAVFY